MMHKETYMKKKTVHNEDDQEGISSVCTPSL